MNKLVIEKINNNTFVILSTILKNNKVILDYKITTVTLYNNINQRKYVFTLDHITYSFQFNNNFKNGYSIILKVLDGNTYSTTKITNKNNWSILSKILDIIIRYEQNTYNYKELSIFVDTKDKKNNQRFILYKRFCKTFNYLILNDDNNKIIFK